MSFLVMLVLGAALVHGLGMIKRSEAPRPLTDEESADLMRRVHAGEFSEAGRRARQDPLLWPETPIHYGYAAPAPPRSRPRSSSTFRPYELQPQAAHRPASQEPAAQTNRPDHYRTHLSTFDPRSHTRTPDGGVQYDGPFQFRNQWGEDNDGEQRYR